VPCPTPRGTHPEGRPTTVSRLIDAWGIVDRDALTQQGRWTEFFETDDGVFATIEPLHPHVKVLRCWEIENYLLHPEIIEEFLVDEHGRSRRPLNQVLEGVFDIVCRLIPIVAANLILNRDGRTKLPDGFGLGQLFEDIYQGVRSRIECDLSPEAADELDNFVEKIVAFSGSVSHRSLDHWLRQIRIVDGKRLIRWLRHEHNLGDRDVRWHLARLTRDRRRIADELEQMIVDLVA